MFMHQSVSISSFSRYFVTSWSVHVCILSVHSSICLSHLCTREYCIITSNWEVPLPSLLPKLLESAVSPVRDTRKIRQSESSIHHLSCTSRFRMIDGDSCMAYVACPLRPTRLRLVLFATCTTVLQRPAPRFHSSSLRSLQAPLWSLHTLQLESHELKPVDHAVL